MIEIKILYFVPMIHTQEEFGSIKEAMIKTRKRIFGEKQTEEFFDKVAQYWQEVEKRIEVAGLNQPENVSGLHVFVDSLPNVDKGIVQKIVQELIYLDIPAYRIIKKLQAGGAKIHGTENPGLLLQEHQYWTALSKGKKQEPTEAQKILNARDQAMAERIDDVMRDDKKMGLLFVGRAHNVIGELIKLRPEFKIIYL